MKSAEASSSGDFGSTPGSGSAGEALSEKDLGARISVLFRIHGDPQHPFSEVVGVLQRVERKAASEAPLLHIVRRNGQLVAVRANDVVKVRILDGRPVRDT